MVYGPITIMVHRQTHWHQREKKQNKTLEPVEMNVLIQRMVSDLPNARQYTSLQTPAAFYQ